MPDDGLKQWLAAPSVWQLDAGEAPRQDTPLPRRVDLAVLGAGLGGLSAALHGLEAGCSVCVLEAQRVGAGASGRNSGFVVPAPSRQTPASLERLLGEAAGPFVRGLQEAGTRLLQGPGASAVQGWAQPWDGEVDPAAVVRLADDWRRLGVEARAADRDALQARIGTDRYAGGLCFERGGQIDPYAAAQGLAERVRQAGGSLVEGCPALTLRPRGEGYLIRTPQGDLLADRVLVAGNAYGREASATTRRAISPLALVLATFAGDVPGEPLPFSDNRKDMWFFRRLADGRLLTGCFALPGLDRRQCEALLGQRIRHLYGVEPGPLQHVWAGWVGLTLNALPRIESRDARLLHWSGCNGRGLALSSLMGRLLVERLLGGDGLGLPPAAPSPWQGMPLLGWLGRLAIALDRRRRHRGLPAPVVSLSAS